MYNIYNHNNSFDKDVVMNRISEIEGKIHEVESEEPSKEREDKIRRLLYAQLIAGLRLNTGFCRF